MGVHKKLMQARMALQSKQLKKSGVNAFAKYEYFELGDFLPTVQSIFNDVGLCGVVSFAPDVATLTITDCDDGTSLAIQSPMAEANLKGCHPIQNLGAVETYTRRYLWVTAMEIVEHDALDATTGKEAPRHAPATTEQSIVKPERVDVLINVADNMRSYYSNNDVIAAFEEYESVTDAEERAYVWALLKPDSKLRAAIKAHGQSLKG